MLQNETVAALATKARKASEFSVRLVVPQDMNALIAMGRDMHAENGAMPFSEMRARDTIGRAILKQGLIGAAIGPVGNPEAVTLLNIAQYWYSDYGMLEEWLVYVKPEFRNSARAKCLLEYNKKCAEELRVPLLIGVLSNDRTAAKIRLYKRVFGEPTGAYFLYNGKTGTK